MRDGHEYGHTLGHTHDHTHDHKSGANLMSDNLQHAFRALGDPTRRQILQQLCGAELSISEVVEQFDLTRTAVRKHLTILEEGQLIVVTPKGKERISRLNSDGLRKTVDWFSYFDQYWDNALISLKDAAEADTRKTKQKDRK